MRKGDMRDICKGVYWVFLIGFVLKSSAYAAVVVPKVNCLSINAYMDKIVALKKHGNYREVTPTAKSRYFDYQSLPSFSEYLAFTRQKIAALNPKAHMPCPLETAVTEKYLSNAIENRIVVDLIQPFEVVPQNASTVIVLLHGLTDSPFVFHDIADQLYQQGYAVRTMLLPGHATAPADLINAKVEDWQIMAEYSVRRALKDYKKVYLGGFSTGGALLIDQLLSNKLANAELKRIRGLLLWSPASKAKSDFSWAAQYVDYIPFFDYLAKGADIDIAKYESFPINAGAQVHQLMTTISAKRERFDNQPDIPVFTVASDVDTTISTEATIALLARWHNNKNRQTKTQDHLMYFGREKLLNKLPSSFKVTISQCRDKSYCGRLMDIAHTATTNAPTNSYYGVNGVYRNCQHISDDKQFNLCKTRTNNFFGEITADNLAKKPAMQRLTFNPQFDEMIGLMNQFLIKTNKN
ncbi:alpha/beta hydrolase [Thalassotalea sediminis]|uniref:alpha/beta hydrolase n=1 Tax=Thalassotalea sediminis TaxID=1759089 RepID=UPI0025739EDE|nr:alpha/beta fold hydrolase [Thalassotalea sediminis]